MNKYLGVVVFLLIAGCSNPSAPKKLYIADWSSLSALEQEQITEALNLLQEGSGEKFISFSGNRPLLIFARSLPGTQGGEAKPLTYKCEISLDFDQDLIRAEPRISQYIFIHELGHCYGLNYSSDSDSVMYPIYPATWDSAVENKLKEFAKQLRDLSQ